MTELRYPRKEIYWDYARGGTGLALVFTPLVSVPMLSGFQIVFGAIAALFAGYVVRTWVRARSHVEIGGEGLAIVGPVARAIAWAEIDRIDLRYFATRREKNAGWLTVTVRGGGRKIAIDSAIEGFDGILRRLADVARANALELSETTVENFSAAGIEGLDDLTRGDPDGVASKEGR